jgi:hypothetical protein
MECGGLAAALLFATSTAEPHPNGRSHPNIKAAAKAAALHKLRGYISCALRPATCALC